MYEIQHLNVWSTAKVFALVTFTGYVLWFLVAVVLFGVLDADTLFDGIIPSLIGLPVAAAVGLGAGALLAVLYNWLGAGIGYIQVDLALEPDEQVKNSPDTHV